MWKVPLFMLNYDEREPQAVSEVIRGGWITMGDQTRLFEEEFAAFLGGGAKCTAVSSGTAALHVALLALGIGPGDEVVVPALTFVADINVVLLVGAKPVLADCVSMTDWNMSAETVTAALSPKTRAVMVLHFAGYPCSMDPIQELCLERRIPIIEDAAHAPGAEYRGMKCGRIGTLGCFSFFSNKNISTGEGGMVATTSEDLDRGLRHIRSHGMTTLTLDRHQGRAVSYDVVRPGLNYRMDEMRAALGRVQLQKLPEANLRRQELTRVYRERLSALPGVVVPFANGDPGTVPSFHILPILLPAHSNRTAVMESLKQQKIQSSIHYPPFQDFSAFRTLGLGSTPVAQEISRRELTLPLYPTMMKEEVDLVTSALSKAL